MRLEFSLVLVPAFSLGFYCVLLIILLRSRRTKIIKSYSFYIGAMILWSFGSLLMRINCFPSPMFWNRILCIGLICMPVMFYNFTLTFTETHNSIKLRWVIYVSAIVFVISNFLGLIIREIHIKNNKLYYTLGFMSSVLAIWIILCLILSFIIIIENIKLNRVSFKKVKFIFLGLIIVIVGGILDLIPRIGTYPIDIASNTINAILIAYSIYKYRFLELKLIIKKGITYIIYIFMLATFYIITAVIVKSISKNFRFTTLISATVMGIIIVFAFQPLKNSIQQLSDKLFYRDNFLHRNAIKDFSEIINSILDIDELSDSLLQVISKGIQAKKVALILRNENNEGYYLFKVTNTLIDKDIKFDLNNPIIEWLNKTKQIITIQEINNSAKFSGLWSTEKEDLLKIKAELFIPISFCGNLTGILVLAEKQLGEPYTQDDLDLLMAFVNSAAVAIDNAKLYAHVRKEAITDGLTKLYNHRYFHESLNQIIKSSEISIFSIIMIDVDFFKIYNDLYGHSAGDKALSKIAELICESVKSEGIACRYGGEEFAIIVPNLNGHQTMIIAEKIRYKIEEFFNLFDEPGKFITASLGVASFPENCSSPEEILESADKAMYIAKNNGKNRCILYENIDYKEVNKDDEYEKMQNSIKSAYFSAICALAATIDVKDHYTYGHSENVSEYAAALATAAGFQEKTIMILKKAGLLHDIGKIGIPENILTKPVKLTEEEVEIMKTHVNISITIIKHIPSLMKVIPAILCHHEKYDGTGYPRGIKGDSIPLEGRCLSIVDAFDAMTSNRSYRKAITPKEAIEELKKNSGTQFDPELVEIFINAFNEGKINVKKR